jgi:hypothetical protein
LRQRLFGSGTAKVAAADIDKAEGVCRKVKFTDVSGK